MSVYSGPQAGAAAGRRSRRQRATAGLALSFTQRQKAFSLWGYSGPLSVYSGPDIPIFRSSEKWAKTSTRLRSGSTKVCRQ